jgi:hypothetical protein
MLYPCFYWMMFLLAGVIGYGYPLFSVGLLVYLLTWAPHEMLMQQYPVALVSIGLSIFMYFKFGKWANWMWKHAAERRAQDRELFGHVRWFG